MIFLLFIYFLPQTPKFCYMNNVKEADKKYNQVPVDTVGPSQRNWEWAR